MDYLTFTVSMTKALVWPVVLLVIVWNFRTHLPRFVSDLTGRLKSAKGAGVEMTFGEKLDKVEEVLSQDPVKTAEIDYSNSAILQGDLPPGYIVTQAWLRIQHEATLTLQAIGAPDKENPDLSANWLRRLKLAGILPEDELNQLYELRELRNRTAHDYDPSVSRTDALRYNDIADTIIGRLRERRLSTE